MALVIRWTSYEQYLAALTSRHRQKVKRGLSLAQKSGLKVRWTDLSANSAQALAAERENVRSLASEYSREQITPAFFKALDAAFGSRARVLEVMKGQKRVGHALVVDDGDVLRWLSFGRTEGGMRDGAYFLVIANIVEMAISEGKAMLDMGITTQGPKTDFGADRVRQWLLLRFRGLPGHLLAPALGLFNPERGEAARRAFKEVD